MMQDYFESNIPERFQAVKKIQNRSAREYLTKTVFEITQTVQELVDKKIDLKVKRVYDRYMDYLESSCARNDRLNHRSEWLARYGEIVLHQLKAYQIQNTRNDPHEILSNREMFSDRFFELVDEMTEINHLVSLSESDVSGFIVGTIRRITDRLTTGRTTYSPFQLKTLCDQLDRVEVKVRRILNLNKLVDDNILHDLHDELIRLERKELYYRNRGLSAN